MTAMNLSPEVIDGSFRVSICRDTTKEEIDKLVEVIRNDILPRVRR
jgi:cysteine sulfinate desulfinase/cysteine desulfurase-like protein